jgi:hypothetical protein
MFGGIIAEHPQYPQTMHFNPGPRKIFRMEGSGRRGLPPQSHHTHVDKQFDSDETHQRGIYIVNTIIRDFLDMYRALSLPYFLLCCLI